MHLADEIEEWLTMLSLAHEGADVLWPQLGLDMTTAKDVADRLGIAVSTVGRALSDDPRISSETKTRVTQAAAELGYTPNRAARMMRGASSGVIGLVVPDIRTGLYSTVAHVLANVLSESAYQLTLVETGDDPHRELQQVSGLAAARAAGIVIVPTGGALPETSRLLTAIPHVQLMRRQPELGGQLFGIDDHRAVERATGHLLALGHRRIAYVGGTADLPTGAARLAGFRNALDAAGLPDGAGPAYLTSAPTAEHGADAVRRMLIAGRPPTALVSGSLQATRGVLDELLAQGVEVPGELSVVGFGDEPGWSWWGPGLTTTALPADRLASASALWLLHRLATPNDRPEESTARALPCPLTVRGSTAPPPAASPTPSFPAHTGRSSSTADAAPSSTLQRSPR